MGIKVGTVIDKTYVKLDQKVTTPKEMKILEVYKLEGVNKCVSLSHLRGSKGGDF